MAEAHSSGTATATRPGLSPVTFPQLGESVVEGTVLQWLVKVGDTVEEDQLLTEIETEKVVAEIPSPFKGVVKEFAVEIGQTVPVGTTLLWVETDAAAAAEAASAPAPIEAATEAEPKKAEMEMDSATAQMESATMPKAAQASASTATNGAKAYTESADASKMYSPAVRKLAMEFNIDPATVKGTGAGGRVTREDMMKAHAAQGSAEPNAPSAEAAPAAKSETPAAPAAQPTAQPAPAARQSAPAPAQSSSRPEGSPSPQSSPQSDLIPMTAIRRRTAEALTKAAQTIPQAASWVEADVTELVARRDAEKQGFLQREGVPLTYLPFFVMAGLAAIRQYPIISSRWTDEGIRIIRQVGFGIAVSTDNGLQVPVIHNAGDYSITGLAKRLHDIIGRARDGKLKIEDIEGASLTLTNPGSFGSHVTMAMVRPNEACIYSVDAIIEKPVVRNGGIAIRSMVTLGITFDHRIFDGREAVLFLNAAKKWLEEEAATAAL
jgi:pyruvate/2-oxoglutarate dehydrogenase complex dihydrolipoamide acyltransferase (E2) component